MEQYITVEILLMNPDRISREDIIELSMMLADESDMLGYNVTDN